jgi:hypothetical protein
MSVLVCKTPVHCMQERTITAQSQHAYAYTQATSAASLSNNLETKKFVLSVNNKAVQQAKTYEGTSTQSPQEIHFENVHFGKLSVNVYK